jgi:hypothetical protein
MYRPGSQFKTVIKYARNLHDMETFGKMDPYVQVILGSREARTSEKTDAGVNPVFDEEIVLDFQNEDEVDFRVWDGESMGSDKFIGEARISIRAVINNGGSWAGDLQLYRKGQKPSGLLNVHIFLIPADSDKSSPSKIAHTPSAPGMYPDASDLSPPEMNPNYNPQSSAPNPMPSQPMMTQAYAQPLQAQPYGYPQPVVAQATVIGQPAVYANTVMAQPGVVYAQPQVVYPQFGNPVVMSQPQVLYRPPGTTYVYRQF